MTWQCHGKFGIVCLQAIYTIVIGRQRNVKKYFMSHYALNVSLQTVMHGFVSKCHIIPSEHVFDFDYNISPLPLFIKSNYFLGTMRCNL